MKVNFPRKSRKFPDHQPYFIPFVVSVVLAVPLICGALWGGYRLGLGAAGAGSIVAGTGAQRMQFQLDEEQQVLESTRNKAGAHLDALALRLGEMQANLLRMEALGEQLVKAGQLDYDEFNFGETPPRGGVDASADAVSVELPELLADIELLERSIADRTHKLELMQGMIVDSRIQNNLHPEGQPVESGWVSSGYGYRKDPFSGKKTFHHGVDIASKWGSPVYAVASGIVMEAKEKPGYGYHVEIVHADGLVTKYAHNSKLFVEPGDLVEKGDIIGRVGSSGRSTGPHVHFEIAQDGKSINPTEFLKTN